MARLLVVLLALLGCISATATASKKPHVHGVYQVLARHTITIGKVKAQGGKSVWVTFKGGDWSNFIGAAHHRARQGARWEAMAKARRLMLKHRIGLWKLNRAKHQTTGNHWLVKKIAPSKPKVMTRRVVAKQMVVVRDKTKVVKKSVVMKFTKATFKKARAAALRRAKALTKAEVRRIRAILVKKHAKYLKKAEADVKKSLIRSGADAILRTRLKRVFYHKCGKMSYRFRRIDGSCNSWRFVKLGAAGTPFKFLTKRGSKQPTGGDRPSARVVSNTVHHDHKTRRNRRRMSEMVVFMGQFIDHTLAETENDKKQKFFIPVPKNDRFFKGTKHIEFLRTMKKKTPRGWSPVNLLPSHVDLAVTYGAHKEAADAIRVFKKGELKSGKSKFSTNMLPRDKDGFFMSGDRRVNENPSLTAMHTLFKREHNRLCAEVEKAFPKYNDDLIYQLARKINGALFQTIVYDEFLPTVLGRKLPYTGTHRFVAGLTDPSVSDEFSVMAFRVGHTLVNDHMTFIRSNRTRARRLLKTVFFKPKWFDVYSIEDCFRGMIHTRAAEVDVQIASQLRNFLFSEEKDAKPLDLCSLNIQRGRDHRLPSYVHLRKAFKLSVPTKFSDITRNRRVQRQLKRAYGHVNKIDGFTGGLAEDHVRGSSLGPLFFRIWVQEFMRLRNGDRFYYERTGGFFPEAIAKIPTLKLLISGKLKGKALAYILAKNTDMSKRDLKNLWYVPKPRRRPRGKAKARK